jgi:hypothetical protein
MWNIVTVKWAFLESIGKSGGIIVMWDISIFEVSSIEFEGQWISLYGKHVSVYVASSVQDRAKLWEDITTLKFAFEIPMVVIGDFNGTLHAHERSSGYFNHSGVSFAP